MKPVIKFMKDLIGLSGIQTLSQSSQLQILLNEQQIAQHWGEA